MDFLGILIRIILYPIMGAGFLFIAWCFYNWGKILIKLVLEFFGKPVKWD